MTWFVVRTNIKCEEKAERSLRRAGYEVYLPRMKIERQHKRTKKWLVKELFLFPRYLFVAQPDRDANWLKARLCDGVESVLGVCGTPAPVPSSKIETLQRMQADLQFDDTRAAKLHRQEIGKSERETTRMRFPPGTKVRAKDGPFAGFRGFVANVGAKGAVEVMVTLFGRLTPVPFPVEQVERINSDPVDEKSRAA